MKLLYSLIDDMYPMGEITHTRRCGRAIIINSKNEVCMLHLVGDDDFGHRDYYETPGGGVEPNETPLEAAIRESAEEAGVITSLVLEIGIVDDYYNLIKRHNLNYYYLLKVDGITKTHMLDYEKGLIKEIVWKPIDEAIKMLEDTLRTPIATLVIRRELPIYKLVRDMLKRGI